MRFLIKLVHVDYRDSKTEISGSFFQVIIYF